MKTIGKGFIWVLVSLLVVVSMVAACAAPKEQVTPTKEVPTQEVVVGILSDLTGPAVSIFAPAQMGAESYFKWVNETKGGIKGKMGTVKVNVVPVDTKYDVARAKEGFAKLKDMGMIVVLTWGGGLCDGLTADFERDHIALVSGSNGAKCGSSPWVFSAAHGGHPKSLNAIYEAAKYWLNETKGEKLTVAGFVSGDVPYAHLGLVGNEEFLAKQGFTIQSEFLPAGTTDFTPALAKLKAAKCQFIIMGGPLPEAIATLKGMDLLGMDKTRIATYCWTSATDLARLGGWQLLQGYKFGHWQVPSNITGEPMPEGHALMMEIIEKYHPGQAYQDFFAYAMAQCLVIEEGIRLALDNVPPDQLNGDTLRDQGLLRMKNFNPLGLAHSVTYESGRPNIGPGYERLYEVVGEQAKAVTPWIKYSDLIPPK